MNSAAETVGRSTGDARSAARDAADNPVVVWLGRAGWVAKGVVWALVGALAIAIGAHTDSPAEGAGTADKGGAISAVAESPLGRVGLAVLGIGLVLYALWQLARTFMPAEDAGWASRLGHLGSAAVYGFFAWVVVASAAAGDTGGQGSGGGTGGDSTFERVSATFLEHNWGQWALGAVGLAVIGRAVWLVAKGVKRDYLDSLDLAGAGQRERRLLEVTGTAGWIGRAAVVFLIGVFLVRAAYDYDPAEAAGIDGALREVADSGPGSVVVFLAACGLVAYGAFCILSARRQELTA